MFLFINASPKLIVTEKAYAQAFQISNNLKLLGINLSCEKQQFLSSLGPLSQNDGYFTQFEIFSHIGGFRRSHNNLNSEIINLK